MARLPTVKSEIGHPMAHAIKEQDDEQFVVGELTRLRTENPIVADFIERFSHEIDDWIGAAFCGLVVYRLLESQAEADAMSQEIPLG